MRRIIPILLILAVIGGGTYWWSQQQTQAATGLKGSGTIEVEQINLGPEVSGRVIQVLAEEGQPVTAGQVLFRLDDTLLKAQRTQAEAEMAGTAVVAVPGDRVPDAKILLPDGDALRYAPRVLAQHLRRGQFGELVVSHSACAVRGEPVEP